MRKRKNEKPDIVSKLIKTRKPKSDAPDGRAAHGQKYRITPLGVLMLALSEVYGADISKEKLDEFSKKLISGLSNIATEGRSGTLLGQDFNEFFMLYVETMNICAKMKDLLDENGIEFDPYADGFDEGRLV